MTETRSGPTAAHTALALMIGMLAGLLAALAQGCVLLHEGTHQVGDAELEDLDGGALEDPDGAELEGGRRELDSSGRDGVLDAGTDGEVLPDGDAGELVCAAPVAVQCPPPAPTNNPGELLDPTVWRWSVATPRSTCQGSDCTYRCAWLDVPAVAGWEWFSWGLGVASCAGSGQPIAPGRYGYPLAPRYGTGVADHTTWTLEARPTECHPDPGPGPVLEVGRDYAGAPAAGACE